MSDLDLDAIEPFDQKRHLGRPPWKNDLAVEAWEKAHGHDVRVKCYVEYGCRAIEAENERLIGRVATLEGGMAQILCVVGLAVAKGQMGEAAQLQRVAQIADTLLDAGPSVAEMAGSFEGGPDSVEWLRDQRADEEADR